VTAKQQQPRQAVVDLHQFERQRLSRLMLQMRNGVGNVASVVEVGELISYGASPRIHRQAGPLASRSCGCGWRRPLACRSDRAGGGKRHQASGESEQRPVNFSVASAMNFPKSAIVIGIGSAPILNKRPSAGHFLFVGSGKRPPSVPRALRPACARAFAAALHDQNDFASVNAA
jgi:hypothetical protein